MATESNSPLGPENGALHLEDEAGGLACIEEGPVLSGTSPIDEKFSPPASPVSDGCPKGPASAKAEAKVVFPDTAAEGNPDRGGSGARPATAGPLYLPVPRVECSKRPISAKRLKEVLQAKKARKDKLFSKITFTQSDTKYYNLFPVQPAVGWWKSVLTNSNYSISSLSRMVRSFDIPIPDTVFCSSTDCFYITNRPDALHGATDSASRKKAGAGARNGWLIKSDFSAAKLLETNLTARLQAEEHDDALQPYQAAAPVRSLSVGNAAPAKKDGAGRRRRGLGTKEGPAGTVPSSSRGPVFYPAAVMKQMHYMKKDCNITKALDLSTFSSVASDSSVERVFQVRAFENSPVCSSVSSISPTPERSHCCLQKLGVGQAVSRLLERLPAKQEIAAR